MYDPYPKPIKKEKPIEDCEIKVKRDNNGRIIGLKTKGKCTKEDREVFARENNINIEEK